MTTIAKKIIEEPKENETEEQKQKRKKCDEVINAWISFWGYDFDNRFFYKEADAGLYILPKENPEKNKKINPDSGYYMFRLDPIIFADLLLRAESNGFYPKGLESKKNAEK